MYNEKLMEKVFKKLEDVMKLYASYIAVKVGEIENPCFFDTEEHLRTVPAEGWRPVQKGEKWGTEEWSNRWVKGSFTVTKELAGKKLHAVSRAGGIEQLFFVDGSPVGLFNTKNFNYIGGNHSTQPIGVGTEGQVFELACECYAGHFCAGNGPYSEFFGESGPYDYTQTYNGIDVCLIDEDVRTLVFDLRELLGAVHNIDDSNFLKHRAKAALEKVNLVLVRDPEAVSESVWRESVKESLKLTRPFFSGKNSRIFGKVGIIGHSHMDTAWLWPVSETIRKCARTYANALTLMDEYPTYNFIQSSALHCEWMKDYYPDIFKRMQKRVKDGRYEPNGGVYVECDCNVTSGELMVRQFLKGQLFTRKYFDYTADSFWLPDTFGYNANIPQIMLGCKVKYFYTTKISWNEMNKFPYESFRWRGLDGSEVLTHFNITHHFPDVEDIVNSVKEMQLKETTDMRLMAFGFGDGGGGPTAGMCETAERASRMEGMPEIVPTTISGFMKELEANKQQLPLFDGELYLELHRGTLTQMHNVKRKNRKAEFALRNMEYFNVLTGKPMVENADKWTKTLLLNQFHDILPGTCITPVYEKYNTQMDELIDDLQTAGDSLAAELTDNGDSYTLFNTLSFDRSDVQTIENASGYAEGVPSQRYTDLCGRDILAVGGVTVPAMGTKTVSLCSEQTGAESAFSYDGTTLETPFAKITFGEDGYIASFVDKRANRELRKEGGQPLNCLLFAEDIPHYWDNWDIERDAIERLTPITGFKGRKLITDGAVELRLRSEFSFGEGSSIVQDTVVYADSPRVDFHTLVDWNEKHHILKAGFDLDIRTAFARNEIQFGHVQRPTTCNNSLECAKFEVCNYKWTDVSEGRFGAAVLNDCKYGITVEDCNLRLSLHRGGTHPDVTGDKGVHEMTYSLLPHDSGFCAENVIRPAYELNIPTAIVKGEANLQQFIKICAPNVICEALKPAENGTSDYVLRLYECEGSRAATCVSFGEKPSAVYVTDMLEDKEEKLCLKDGALELTFRPFEIKTLLVER